jgi:hypothetical protein
MTVANGVARSNRRKPVEATAELSPTFDPRTGRIPPHDLDAEAVVISACILDEDDLALVVDKLSPSEFYSEANRWIYEAMLELKKVGTHVDVVSVVGWLRDHERLVQVGGPKYLVEIVDNTRVVAHVEEKVARLVDFARVRKLIATAQQIAAEGYGVRGDDVQRFLDGARSQVVELVDASATAESLVVPASEIFAPLSPVNYLVEALDICPGAPTMVAGYGFSMKTISWQSAAIGIATGRRVWNEFKARRGRVLHIDYEQGRPLTFRRYQRLAVGMGIDWRELEGQLAVLSLPTVHFESITQSDALCRLVDGYDLVIFDSYRASCPAIEENSSEARVPLDLQLRASDRTGATFVTIHHCRKPTEGAPGGARMALRGSSAIYDALGSALIFEGTKGEPTRVLHEKARTSGVIAETFYLEVLDVAVDEDPRAGLLVRTKAAEAVEPTATARFADTCERVFEAIGKHQGVSVRVLREHVDGIRWNTIGAAVEQLAGIGRIVNLGSKARPAWHIASGTTSLLESGEPVPEAVPALRGRHTGTTSLRGAGHQSAPVGHRGTTHTEDEDGDT